MLQSKKVNMEISKLTSFVEALEPPFVCVVVLRSILALFKFNTGW